MWGYGIVVIVTLVPAAKHNHSYILWLYTCLCKEGEQGWDFYSILYTMELDLASDFRISDTESHLHCQVVIEFMSPGH